MAAYPIESFTDAFVTERRLLNELIGIMRRQRAAASNDDRRGISDSVFATHRVLVTLNEARRRRRTLNTLIGRNENSSIHALDEALGACMTPALREARDGLQVTARALSREVALNRQVLRETLGADTATQQ
jgi:hypothetical protein